MDFLDNNFPPTWPSDHCEPEPASTRYDRTLTSHQTANDRIDLRKLTADISQPAVGFVLRTHNNIVQKKFWGNTNLKNRLMTSSDSKKSYTVLMGRLHYKHELLSRFSIDSSKEPENDAFLVRTLFEGHGVDGLKELEGDFALVCVEKQNAMVCAMRDQAGGYQLFFGRNKSGLFVSSNIIPLRAYD